MGATVKEAQQRLTLREFLYERLYWQIEPYGDEWGQTARQIAWMVACHGVESKESAYMPCPDPRIPKKTTLKQKVAAVMAWAQSWGLPITRN